jgi:hypothetical protein
MAVASEASTILTCMVGMNSYVPSNSVPEVLHERIQRIAVPLNLIICFSENVFSESLPFYYSRRLSMWYVQQLEDSQKLLVSE